MGCVCMREVSHKSFPFSLHCTYPDRTRCRALQKDHFRSRRPAGSLTAPVRDLQIVIPVEVVSAQLPATDDGVASIGQRAGESLRESRSVPP